MAIVGDNQTFVPTTLLLGLPVPINHLLRHHAVAVTMVEAIGGIARMHNVVPIHIVGADVAYFLFLLQATVYAAHSVQIAIESTRPWPGNRCGGFLPCGVAVELRIQERIHPPLLHHATVLGEHRSHAIDKIAIGHQFLYELPLGALAVERLAQNHHIVIAP